METDYTGYALDYETMQTQEYYEDMDGNIDKSQYKAQWSGADDCYYSILTRFTGGCRFIMCTTRYLEMRGKSMPRYRR